MPKSIHIGIDGNEANIKKRVGSNHYAYAIIKAIYDLDQTNRYTIYLKSTPVSDMPIERENWRYKLLRPSKLWTQWRLPLELYINPSRPQIFFSPGHYAPRFSPIPTVVSIMDLAFIKYPNLFLKFERGVVQLKDWTQYSVNNSKHVIAISQHTKNDVAKIYHKDKSSITVAYPGINQKLYQPQDPSVINAVRKKYRIGKDYIVYVGTIQPRKNLTRILRAYESLPRTYKNLEWVIVGQEGWMYDNLLRQIKKSPKKKLIKRIGYAASKDLPAIYAGAHCTLLIGLYEGFGMPAAESLSCGTIPVVSNTSSLPEVVGKAGVSVNPFSITSIKRGILYTLKLSKTDKQKKLAIAKDQLKQFDWVQSAKIIINVLKNQTNN